jgi:hypothetical protein
MLGIVQFIVGAITLLVGVIIGYAMGSKDDREIN